MIKTTLKVEGMACSMCEAHVNDAIRKAFAVKKVSSSHEKKNSIIISEEALDKALLKETIGKTGYTLLSIESDPYEKKAGLFSFLRK